VEFDPVLLRVASGFDQTAADGDVAIAEQQERFRRQAVPPRPAGFVAPAW
jgi:hypothetical protein